MTEKSSPAMPTDISRFEGRYVTRPGNRTLTDDSAAQAVRRRGVRLADAFAVPERNGRPSLRKTIGRTPTGRKPNGERPSNTAEPLYAD